MHPVPTFSLSAFLALALVPARTNVAPVSDEFMRIVESADLLLRLGPVPETEQV